MERKHREKTGCEKHALKGPSYILLLHPREADHRKECAYRDNNIFCKRAFE
jgi:hypothetical protein